MHIVYMIFTHSTGLLNSPDSLGRDISCSQEMLKEDSLGGFPPYTLSVYPPALLYHTSNFYPLTCGPSLLAFFCLLFLFPDSFPD